MTTPNLSRYKWFQYEGREVEFTENRHSEEYELHLKPGNVYGVQKVGRGYILIHKNSPDIEFELKSSEISRLNDHSRGWVGKVKRVKVTPGVGALDKPGVHELHDVPKNLHVMNIDSSNLKAAIYDKKRKNVYVEFHNGAKWCYLKVTPKEAREMEAGVVVAGSKDGRPSQGRYFIYRIREVKEQYRLDDHTELMESAINPQE